MSRSTLLCILGLALPLGSVASGGERKKPARGGRGWMDCKNSPAKHPGPWRPIKDTPEGARLRKELAGRGRIAFASNRDGNWEIYATDPDGRGQVNLTKNPAWDFYPRWSPDGKRIVFFSDRDSEARIAGRVDQLMQLEMTWTRPRNWEPKHWGAYVGVKVGVYSMNPDGSDVKRLVPLGSNACLSPDGKFVAYEYEDTLHILNLGTGKSHLGTPPHWGGAWEPSFSEDGKQILCMTGNEAGYSPTIFPLGPGCVPTGAYRVLCNGGEACHPRWAPGCKRVIYSQDTRGAKLRWVSLDEKGEGDYNFLPGKDIDLGVDDKKIITVCPTVSPDGKYIACAQSPVYFEVKRKAERLGYKHWNYGRQIIWQELCVARADGKALIQITDGGYANRDPDWFIPKE